ncbi:hypothetical protein, partial [Streptomyces sp. NPDC054838]
MTTPRAAEEDNGKALPPGTARTVPDKGKWAVVPLNSGKQAYTLPAEWKAGALHHKIAKEKLSWIAEQLVPAFNAQDKRLREAAQAFWSVCWKAAGKPVTDAVAQAGSGSAPNPHRLLWNIPLMVSIGPPSPATDPGMNFDPDTEPVPGGRGARRTDAVSSALKELEDAWFRASEAQNGAGAYDAALWQELARHLETAHQASRATDRDGRVLFPPLYEQWVFDSKTSQNLRKGLTSFPTPDEGTKMFRDARSGAPDISAYAASAAPAAT